MSYSEQLTNLDLEIDNSQKTLKTVQTPFKLKKLLTTSKIFIILSLALNCSLIYTAFLLSYYLRFNSFNFDNVFLRREEIGHYLNLGGIYALTTTVILALTTISLPYYKVSFIRTTISIAATVLSSIAIITLMALLDPSTIFFSRMVFAFLAPVTWLVLTLEFGIATILFRVINTYNTRHYSLVEYAISLSDQNLISLQNRSKTTFLTKRIVDIVGALIILGLAFVPIILIAIAVKLDSKGPVIFKQVRVGRNGKHFNFYKFRSMFIDADSRFEHLKQFNETQGATFKMKNDPRVTRVGRFLRRSSLDELPQLINVLLGQMSLVGPRPGLPREVVLYQDWQHRRLEAVPGLTGLWQVSGRSSLGFEEMTKLDIYYMYRCSPWMDLKILIKTIATVFTGKGAY